MASLVAQMVKNESAIQETWVRSLGREDHWRRTWQSTPVFLPGESHGHRSLRGYSPWGRIIYIRYMGFHFNFCLQLPNVMHGPRYYSHLKKCVNNSEKTSDWLIIVK